MENLQKQPSTLENALNAFRRGGIDSAAQDLSRFIAQKFDLAVENLAIRQDSLSLNSINGTFDSAGKKLFFKFHMEESEETVQEYYRAELLAKAGYPVEQPLYLSRDVGEQILIYPYKPSERLADMCRRLEKPDQEGSTEFQLLVKAQEELDKICLRKSIDTYNLATAEQLKDEPLLQLFYWRLVDQKNDGSVVNGGRHHDFYIGKNFQFPDDVTLSYDELSQMQWVINGQEYGLTLNDAFTMARKMMAPDYYQEYAACTAHGDAHNGNVWANLYDDGTMDLSWFDPAFAGEHIPVLLSEVKTTFHNIFAHPNWLYDSKEADVKASCKIEDGKIIVMHDWSLPALRAEFLRSKIQNFWKPVLKELAVRKQLPDDWENYIRAALFCCPILVMNLRANAGSAQNSHTPQTSLFGLAMSIMLASAPKNGADAVSEFFDELQMVSVLQKNI